MKAAQPRMRQAHGPIRHDEQDTGEPDQLLRLF
jgi:hypothetical protein